MKEIKILKKIKYLKNMINIIMKKKKQKIILMRKRKKLFRI
jgi:hypothetical protein